MKDTLILGIESSCDETAASVVKNGRTVLSNVISSQIEIHKLYGGVVPEIASRNHIERINQVIQEALDEANVTLDDIDAIGVTYGPGLVGALLVGVAEAKAIAYARNLPLVGVHHIEGHVSANYIEHPDLEPPFLCAIVSGGHTHLVIVKDYGQFEILGRTRDDAAGEAFDKVARAIGLGYPGGPKIDKLAKEGNSIIYVVINNEISAIIGVNDIVRENSKEVISKLNKNKIETVMLTGDNTQTAEKIAKEIGITTVISNVTPREKTEVVKKLKTEGKYVMMCGDGINDSVSLVTADIGVSVSNGTDIAMDSSQVVLMNDNLEKIDDLIEISRKTIRNIKQNLFWAFFYNICMIPIACGVLQPFGITMNPMIAAFAMTISSLTVVLNALRLRI